MGKFRDGMPVTGEAVTLILSTIDRIKEILDELEATEAEPEGNDRDLIDELEAMVERGMAASQLGAPMPAAAVAEAPPLVPEAPVAVQPRRPGARWSTRRWSGRCVPAKCRSTNSSAPSARPRSKLPPPRCAVPRPQPPPPRRRACEAAGTAARQAKAELPRRPRKKPRAAKGRPPLRASLPEGDKVANQSIRVNVDTLEHLMTMVSELVLTRNQLLEISRRNEDTEFKVPLQRLSNVTAELQEGVMKTRMQPIGNAWQKLPRIVRDLSSELGKQIELEMHGADTELDRQVLDLIKDPLTHMVRNSADHGLETPAERLAAGKPEQGTIRLSAYHEGGHIIICIADNGRGLNTDRIKAKAVSARSRLRGRAREDDGSPDPQVHLRAGLLHRGRHHHGLRPRRRHGRGAHQYRPDRRHHRHQVGGRRGLLRHHQDPADARHRLGADRRSRRRPLRDPAALGGRAGARPRQFRAPHRAHQGHRGAAAAQQAAAADASEEAAEDRRRRRPPIPRTASSW